MQKLKIDQKTEDLISMVLGMVIVVVVGAVIFNYLQKRRGGTVNLVGLTDTKLALDSKQGEAKASGEAVEGQYEVKRGESLWKIAVVKYGRGERWVEIAKANNLKNPSMVVVGQKLVLPQLERQNEVKEYVVKKGDYLSKISKEVYNSGAKWTTIWEANRSLIRDPNKIEVGMRLVISR